MKDSIQTIIKTINTTSDNGMELINKVDSFYNSAWDKLIIIGSLAFAIVGVLVPFVIQWYQKQTLKTSENLLKKEIESQISKIKSEILSEINLVIEDKFKFIDSKIEQFNCASAARTYHLQGNGQLSEGLMKDALADYIAAAQNYFKSEDFINLQTILNAISNNCIPTLSIEDIDDLNISHNRSLYELLETIYSKDDKKVFNTVIRQIKFKLSKLPKTAKNKIVTDKQQKI